MIIQDEIQPYDVESKSGEAKLGYFNLHDLKWPNKVFDKNPDVQLTLRATLSHFIDPNPGSRCWHRSKKYRYASHLLRFTFKRSIESPEVFLQNLEKEVEAEESEHSEQLELSLREKEKRPAPDPAWALGPQLRGKSGSLVQDIWQGSPADLAEMNQIAIFPVKGWFATRNFPEGHEFHRCHQRKVRYSLILSIDAEQDIGLYAALKSQIQVDAAPVAS